MLVLNHFTYNNYNANYRLKNQPSFGYNLPKLSVSDIRDVSNLTCGCCGDKMMNTKHLSNFIKSFIPGAKRALENDLLSRFKDSEGYAYLKHLADVEPRKSIRTLMASAEAREKYYKLSQRTQLEVNEIALYTDSITVRAPRVIQKFEKYYDHFSKGTKDILDMMEIYSLKYPNNTFAEIFNKPEVAKYHQDLYEIAKKQSVHRKIEVFKKLAAIKGLSPEDIKLIQKANSDALTILNWEFYQPHIKKALVEDLYKDLISKSSNKSLEKEIMPLIKNFPYDTPYADNFITKCVRERKSDMDIVRFIAEELRATFEHIKPKSKEGTDELSNGIVLCRKCNAERANLPYPFFLKFHPEMVQNIQRQMNRIITFIKHGKLLGYDSYPVEVKQTLLNQSDNILKVNIRKYLRYKQERAAESVKRAKAVFEKDEQLYNAATEKLNNIDIKLEEIMSIVRKIKKERRAAQEILDIASRDKIISKGNLYEAEDSLKNAEDLLEDDLAINKIARKKKNTV